MESIGDTPENLSVQDQKGVLAGASDYNPLDRNRYQLRFQNTGIEGILDCGRNMLAIGTHILITVLDDPKLARKIKRWPDFKDAWQANRPAIETFRKQEFPKGENPLDFLVPLEILVPSDWKTTRSLPISARRCWISVPRGQQS